MKCEWASDFSYDYFRQILKVTKSSFELRLLAEANQFLNSLNRPTLIIRHDVDVSLKKALRIAEIEKELGVRSTYMVMTDSLLYSLEDETSEKILHRIIDIGHHVGLHYNLADDERNNNCEIGAIESNIETACRQLENAIGHPVLSISFHRPIPQLVQGALVICGRLNAYARELMKCYLSDSKGCWREGQPLQRLSKPNNRHGLLLQLLIHPIWWGDVHKSAEDRLQEFFETQTQGQPPDILSRLDDALANTIPAVWKRYSRSEVKE